MNIRKKIINLKLIRKFLGFSFVGAFVTIVSLVTSFIFLKLIRTPLFPTYAVNYSVMITLSYFLNAHFVFKTKYSYKQLLLYYVAYLGGMILGIIILNIFRNIFSFENWILSYMVIPFTMLCNFALSNKILTKRN